MTDPRTKIRIVTASAGSGKTTRLSQELDDAIASGRVRPEYIVATTFTKQAAAELVERSRARLLSHGRVQDAQRLLSARIGTVNSVCGSLVQDFAFELGLSPTLRILDDKSAEIEMRNALAAVVSEDVSDELEAFKASFEADFDWPMEVRKLIEAARANALSPDQLRESATLSSTALDACLGSSEVDDALIDQALVSSLDACLAQIDLTVDVTKGTAEYVALVTNARRDLLAQRLRWGDWAKLAKETPTKKSLAAAAPVQRAAERHLTHPRLRKEMHRLTSLLFAIAADGLSAYEAHKRERGVIDFVDQESLALKLLRRPDVRDALHGQIELVLVDEFQDTSPLQLSIFIELASLATESVWVGDQKQAIYGFRGTDPALMDAVIESLTGAETDPELLRTAVDAVAGATSQMESLGTSYRSRPNLVRLTSDLFAKAFTHHGLPEERTRLEPSLTDEPEGLGAIVEYWPLTVPARENKTALAAATAGGIARLLGARPQVRNRHGDDTYAASARDVAILCRTNAQCQELAEALSSLNIRAVMPTMALLDTAEGRVVHAALRLFVDPKDGLAAAELARLVTYASDLGGFTERVLASPGTQAFASDPLVQAVLAARVAKPDSGPTAAVAASIDACQLRELCAAWGNTDQRLANLDELLACAVGYSNQARARREAATIVGLLEYLRGLSEVWGWKSARTDRQAVLGSADAVTLSTWHAAKGREWPITVLYGLEKLNKPMASGLHIETEGNAFSFADPLKGRWLRYWPNPYTNAQQGGAVRDAYEASVEFASVVERREREALRLLYVGWTRARDRIVLACAAGKLTSGLLGTLCRLDESLFCEAPAKQGHVEVRWAGRAVSIHVEPTSALPPVPYTLAPATVTVGRALQAFAPARLSPSMAVPVACTLGVPITLGPRLSLKGQVNMEHLGHALHGFFAADPQAINAPGCTPEARLALASGLLERYRVGAQIEASDVVEAGDRLWAWLANQPSITRLHREWPMLQRMPSGSIVSGTADLVAQQADGWLLLDHKTFPGSVEAALERLAKYSGQLASYAHTISIATKRSVTSTWIHLPMLGTMVEMKFPPL
jgi:ATP-dependent helicase/nuclease subunit A